jgi:protein SCO1/2
MRTYLALALLLAGPGGAGAADVAPAAQIALVRADGAPVTLAGELEHDGPVALNFVFTTCSAICPVQSQVFAELQARAEPALRLRLMSISLDPLNDTPAVLRAYARKFGAGSGWRFYTGTPEASVAAQQALGAWRGNKMNHQPLVLLRRAPGQPWIRVEGYAGAGTLLRALRGPVPARKIQ